jgi:AcrR family transcriptional regulator/DNA-binding MarR family transcriptional regulator
MTESSVQIRAVRKGRVSPLQRSRLMAGAVLAIDELGYRGATVERISERAHVSRTVFYAAFRNREACVVAVLDEFERRVERLLSEGGWAALAWEDKMAAGLLLILVALERDRALARVCLLESATAGPLVTQRRDLILARLAAELDRGRTVRPAACVATAETAETLVGGCLWVIGCRLRSPDERSLVDLAGELAGMIVLPYLGATTALRQRVRAAAAGERTVVADRSVPLVAPAAEGIARMTYRTARVLEVIAQRPGANSRAVSRRAGISDAGQASRLLARLSGLGLIANEAGVRRRGAEKRWALTSRGREVLGLGAPSVVPTGCSSARRA